MLTKVLAHFGIRARRQEIVPGDELRISAALIDDWLSLPYALTHVVRVVEIKTEEDGTKTLVLTNRPKLIP
jgi:hypothetical protein